MGENFCRSNKNMTEMKKAHDKDGRSAKPKDKKKGTQKWELLNEFKEF